MADRNKRTGTIEPYRTAEGKTGYRGRVRLADGSRRSVDVPAKYSYSEDRARLYIAGAQEREDQTGELLADKNRRASAKIVGAVTSSSPAGETCDEWIERFIKYQRELGMTDATKKRSRWMKWISPKIGAKPMTLVTRNDVEDIRDALDVAIAAWKRDGACKTTITGKTAMNAWSALTSSFRAATSGKRRDLRILDGKPNPCVGVEPPGDRDSRKARRKTFLYPKESALLLACEAISLEWREVYALALYTYLRPGELRVLTHADINLDDGVINVTKAWDYVDEKVKAPKTRNGVRRVPIDAQLMPLLRRMREEATDLSAPIARHLVLYGEDHLAESFRKHLKLAGVDRAELHISTPTHVQSNFRSCRDSGITWLAMSGVSVDKIMRRAGHDHIQTTMGYVKLAEDLTGDLGEPFGPLPPSLLGGSATIQLPSERKTDPKRPVSSGKKGWAQRDLKPEGDVPNSVSPHNPSNVDDEADAAIELASTPKYTATRDAVTEKVAATEPVDVVESALAHALTEAASVGRFDVVAQLAGELQARRLAHTSNVIAINAKRVTK